MLRLAIGNGADDALDLLLTPLALIVTPRP